MKFFIVLVAVLAAVWLWKRGRRLSQDQNPTPPRRHAEQPKLVQDMVSCPVCSVHVPSVDAVKGQRNHYCSEAHRRQAEGT